MQLATATLQVETTSVRVTRWDFTPHSHTGEHVHEFDYVVVPITEGVLTIRTPDGGEVESPLTVGGSYERSAGVEHDVINATDQVISFVEIELLEHPRQASGS